MVGTSAVRHRISAILADRRIPIAALAAAVAAFFCIHSYVPAAGIIGNAIRGEIYLTDRCQGPPPDLQPRLDFSKGTAPTANATAGAVTFDDLVVDPMSCVVRVRFRTVLAFVIALMAVHLMLKRRGTS